MKLEYSAPVPLPTGSTRAADTMPPVAARPRSRAATRPAEPDAPIVIEGWAIRHGEPLTAGPRAGQTITRSDIATATLALEARHRLPLNNHHDPDQRIGTVTGWTQHREGLKIHAVIDHPPTWCTRSGLITGAIGLSAGCTVTGPRHDLWVTRLDEISLGNPPALANARAWEFGRPPTTTPPALRHAAAVLTPAQPATNQHGRVAGLAVPTGVRTGLAGADAEIFAPSAFASQLADWQPVPVYADHDPSRRVGMVEWATEMPSGIYVVLQLDPGHEHRDRAPLSVGFYADETRTGPDGLRVITRARLDHIAVVDVPAYEHAQIIGALPG